MRDKPFHYIYHRPEAPPPPKLPPPPPKLRLPPLELRLLLENLLPLPKLEPLVNPPPPTEVNLEITLRKTYMGKRKTARKKMNTANIIMNFQ
jgi:hypothetical protein